MKNILIALMLAVSTVSCSSCAKKSNVTEPATPAPSCSDSACPVPERPAPSASFSVPPAVSVANVYPSIKVQDVTQGWEFTLPGPGWSKVPVSDAGIQIVLRNSNKSNLMLLVREKFDGTTEQYALLAVHGLKEGGGTLASARQVVVNGTKYVLVESSKGTDIKVWMWLTVKAGNGVGFTCGGPTLGDGDNSQRDLCANVANTLKLK